MLPSSAKTDANIINLHKNTQPNCKKKKQKLSTLHDDHDVNKKQMRKYAERLRRQEMASLCASLRSLLPLEFIKGKRSISDQFNEAAKYIKHLENRIEELGAKREELRKLSNSNLNVGEADESTEISDITTLNPTKVSVSMSECLGGYEVVIIITETAQTLMLMLPLSTLLDILLKHGLTVVNCVYSKVEGRQIYTIRTQVSDRLVGTDDLSATLQRKLEEAIPSSSNSYRL